MRVLVVGSLPPPYNPRSRALLAEAVELLKEAHSVEVVALDPVATAHRYLGLSGLPGALQLLRMARGFDSVVVQLQPGLPVRERAGELERSLSLRTLALVTRRADKASIRIESLEDVPGGLRGRSALRLWRSAEIRTADAALRDRFLQVLGPGAEGVEVVVSPQIAPVEDLEASGLSWDGSPVTAMEIVRTRAARERRTLSPSDAVRPAGWDRLSAPGLAMTESDVVLLGPGEGPPRKPADLARKALAAADRRPGLWRVARMVRLARRGVYSLVGRDGTG